MSYEATENIGGLIYDFNPWHNIVNIFLTYRLMQDALKHVCINLLPAVSVQKRMENSRISNTSIIDNFISTFMNSELNDMYP